MPQQGDTTTYYGICSDDPVAAQKGPLCDEELFNIASSLSGDWRLVAASLGLLDNRISSIERCFPPDERLFAVLREWRAKNLKSSAPHETAVGLANAMFELGRDDIGRHLIKKYKDALECA